MFFYYHSNLLESLNAAHNDTNYMLTNLLSAKMFHFYFPRLQIAKNIHNIKVFPSAFFSFQMKRKEKYYRGSLAWIVDIFMS